MGSRHKTAVVSFRRMIPPRNLFFPAPSGFAGQVAYSAEFLCKGKYLFLSRNATLQPDQDRDSPAGDHGGEAFRIDAE
jgi:hypothetical protein